VSDNHLVFDEAWLRDYCKRTGQQLPDGVADKPPKRGKYNNVRTEQDGKVYDSRKEAARAGELKLLQKAGKIAAYAEQVTFILPGGVRYIADFVIMENDGTYRVEDAKGVRTKEYIIKKKLMKQTHGIDIVEV
jgi:hypothetical protein